MSLLAHLAYRIAANALANIFCPGTKIEPKPCRLVYNNHRAKAFSSKIIGCFMKKILIILLSSMFFTLFARANNRYHVCCYKNILLSFAESSYLNEPIIKFTNKNILTWSGAEIEITPTIENSLFVSALDASEKDPSSLKFIAQQPKDPNEIFHHYQTVVQVRSEDSDIFLPLSCYSQKILIWPVDLNSI